MFCNVSHTGLVQKKEKSSIDYEPLGRPSCCNSFDNVSLSVSYLIEDKMIKFNAAKIAFVSSSVSFASAVNLQTFGSYN